MGLAERGPRRTLPKEFTVARNPVKPELSRQRPSLDEIVGNAIDGRPKKTLTKEDRPIIQAHVVDYLTYFEILCEGNWDRVKTLENTHEDKGNTIDYQVHVNGKYIESIEAPEGLSVGGAKANKLTRYVFKDALKLLASGVTTFKELEASQRVNNNSVFLTNGNPRGTISLTGSSIKSFINH